VGIKTHIASVVCLLTALLFGRAMEPMTILGGPAKGMRDWMTEVQICQSSRLEFIPASMCSFESELAVITKIKERVFARCIPLNGSEKQAIASHTNHWLASRGGGCDTSQPHVQIVSLVSRLPTCFDTDRAAKPRHRSSWHCLSCQGIDPT
jgi:hypothetical protein